MPSHLDTSHLKSEIAWQEFIHSPHPQSVVLYKDLPETLTTMAHLFGESSPGWRAGLLNLPGFESTLWHTPEKQLKLQELLTTLLHGKHNYLTCLLHTPQVLFIGRLEGMVQLETVCPRLAAFLNPGKANDFQYFNLGTHNPEFNRLCEKWAEDARIQQKLEIESTQELTPEQQIAFELTPTQKKIRKDRYLMNILVVEDDPATSLMLAQLMTQHYTVSTAYDAVDAVREYRQNVPDMVFLDIGLPDINGLELLQKITSADPDAFVVMLTANAFKSNLEKALSYGAKGFMAKPFNREKLNTYITAALNQKRRKD